MLIEQDGIIRCISSKQFKDEDSTSIHTQVYRELKKYFLGEFLEDLGNALTSRNPEFVIKLNKTPNTKIVEDSNFQSARFGRPTSAIQGIRLEVLNIKSGVMRVVENFSMHKLPNLRSDGSLDFFVIPFINTVPDCLYRSDSSYSLGLYGKSSIRMDDFNSYGQICVAALITRQLLKTPNIPDDELDLIVRDSYEKLTGIRLPDNKMISSILYKQSPFSTQIKGKDSSIRNCKEAFLNTDKPLLPISSTGKEEILELLNPKNLIDLEVYEDILSSDGKVILKKGDRIKTSEDIQNLVRSGIEFIKVHNYFERDDMDLVIKEIPAGTVIDSNLYRAIQNEDKSFIEETLKTGVTPHYIKLSEPYKIIYDETHDKANLNTMRLSNQESSKAIHICIPQGITKKGKFYLRASQAMNTNGMITHEEFLALFSIANISKKYGIFNVPEIDEDFKNRIISPVQRIKAELKKQGSLKINKSPRPRLTDTNDNITLEVRAQIHRLWNAVMKLTEFTNSTNVFKSGALTDKVTSPAKFKSMKARSINFKQANILSMYSTPPSNKIGLVRSLCKDVIIGKDDIMIAGYRVFNGIIDISEKVPIKRSDILSKTIAFTGSFEMKQLDEKTYQILDDYVKVGKNIAGRYSVYEVKKTEVDYVTVSAESMLSAREACIPMMSKSDGARMVYASAMMIQTVPPVHSEVPYVMTDEWKKVITTDEDIWYKEADRKLRVDKKDKDIYTSDPNISIADALSSDTANTVKVPEEYISTMIVPKRIRFEDGDILDKGDLFYDTIHTKDRYLSNGRNVLIAFIPKDGYNCDDSILVSEELASQFTSHYTETVKSQSPDTFEGRMIISERHKKKASLPDKIGYCIHKYADTSKKNTKYNMNHYKYSKLDVTMKGDKLVGRHGNKSTISKIVKNSEMLMLTNNIPIGIAFNQIGLYPRMNLGAVMDSQLGLIGWLLDVRFSSNSLSGISYDEIKELLRLVYNLSQADDSEQALNMSYRIDIPNLIKEKARERHSFIKTFRGVINQKGEARVKLGLKGEEVMVPVMIGVQYILKLEHIAEHKQKYTGMFSNFHQATFQPDSQRTGEMELDTYDAYGATHLIDELLNIRSDNMEKHKLVAQRKCTIENLNQINFDTNEPFATTVLRSILETFNIYFESDEYDTITDGSADRRFDLE